MYLLDKDVDLLNNWLNIEEEIAFLLPNGYQKWISKREHNIAKDIGKQKFGNGYDFEIPNYAEYNLWHIPSGPLPLIDANKRVLKSKFELEAFDENGIVESPWLGWTEIRPGANSRIPYFGAGHPGVIHLEIKLPDDDEIRLSSFGWIGNHYKIIGNGAKETTEIFWNKLRRMAKKMEHKFQGVITTVEKKKFLPFHMLMQKLKMADLVH
jgi:hypothetical protein